LPDLGDYDEEFELHGPAAGVSTQQANNSEWLANTLEDESNNFFAFLQAELEERNPGLEKADSQELGSDDEGAGRGRVAFEELLPPGRNSKVVGAQGLLHVLTLVTRGAVTVNQEEYFGEIELSIVPGVRLVEKEQDDQDQQGEVIDVDDLEGEEPVEGDEDKDADADMYG
jgi:chromatin segregation and condensation protein Rec8/ScpA/Scc1 (kleisin family)